MENVKTILVEMKSKKVRHILMNEIYHLQSPSHKPIVKDKNMF